MQDLKAMTEQNGPALRAILTAMRITRYNDEHIAQYSRSRATLDATGRHHRASICLVSHQRTPLFDGTVDGLVA